MGGRHTVHELHGHHQLPNSPSGSISPSYSWDHHSSGGRGSDPGSFQHASHNLVSGLAPIADNRNRITYSGNAVPTQDRHTSVPAGFRGSFQIVKDSNEDIRPSMAFVDGGSPVSLFGPGAMPIGDASVLCHTDRQTRTCHWLVRCAQELKGIEVLSQH